MKRDFRSYFFTPGFSYNYCQPTTVNLHLWIWACLLAHFELISIILSLLLIEVINVKSDLVRQIGQTVAAGRNTNEGGKQRVERKWHQKIITCVALVSFPRAQNKQRLLSISPSPSPPSTLPLFLAPAVQTSYRSVGLLQALQEIMMISRLSKYWPSRHLIKTLNKPGRSVTDVVCVPHTQSIYLPEKKKKLH